jgi:hypothetical protein
MEAPPLVLPSHSIGRISHAAAHFAVFFILLNFLSLPVAVHAFPPARSRIHVLSVSLLRTQVTFISFIAMPSGYLQQPFFVKVVYAVLRLRLDGYSSGL